MGTNYYLYERGPCECCGRPYEALHIGKSSAGWCFSLHVIPEEGIRNLADWEQRWGAPGARIESEYGEHIAPETMRKVIIERKQGEGVYRTASYLRENSAVPGPNNLMRHEIGRYCVGHGEGTWDLIPGEFS